MFHHPPPTHAARILTDSASIHLYAGETDWAPLYRIRTEGDGAYWFHLYNADSHPPDSRQSLFELATLDVPKDSLRLQDGADEAWVESPGEVLPLPAGGSRVTLYHNPQAERQRLELRQQQLDRVSPTVTLLAQGTRLFAIVVGGFLTAAGLLATVVLLLGSSLRNAFAADGFATNWQIILICLAASGLGFALFRGGCLAGRLPWIAARDHAEDILYGEIPDYVLIISPPRRG